jgi:hypothetical protein
MQESTATWMEDVVHEDVNDYLAYLPRWAAFDEVPLALDVSSKQYGSAVWNAWLAERRGAQVIREAWEASAAAGSYAPAAYDAALVGRGEPGFMDAFGAFAAAVAEWRWSPTEFSEGASFPDVERRGTLAVGGAAVAPLLDHTTFAYYTAEAPAGGWPAVLRLDGELPRGVNGALALVGLSQANTVTTRLAQLPDGGAGSVALADPGSHRRITAVLVNADAHVTGHDSGGWTWAADRRPFTAALREGTAAPAEPAGAPAAGGPLATAGPQTGPAAGAAPTSVLALSATLSAPARARLARALAGRLVARATCSAACVVAARVELSGSAARRVRAVLAARGTKRLAAAGDAAVALRFTTKARRALKRLRTVRATLVLEVRDAGGRLVASRRTTLVLQR